MMIKFVECESDRGIRSAAIQLIGNSDRSGGVHHFVNHLPPIFLSSPSANELVALLLVTFILK